MEHYQENSTISVERGTHRLLYGNSGPHDIANTKAVTHLVVESLLTKSATNRLGIQTTRLLSCAVASCGEKYMLAT